MEPTNTQTRPRPRLAITSYRLVILHHNPSTDTTVPLTPGVAANLACDLGAGSWSLIEPTFHAHQGVEIAGHSFTPVLERVR